MALPTERVIWVRRVGIAAAVAVALGYLPYLCYGNSGLARYLRLRSERDGLRDGNVRLRRENLRLRHELESLEDPGGATLSARAIERAARDELGLVRPGEVVFKLEADR